MKKLLLGISVITFMSISSNATEGHGGNASSGMDMVKGQGFGKLFGFSGSKEEEAASAAADNAQAANPIDKFKNGLGINKTTDDLKESINQNVDKLKDSAPKIEAPKIAIPGIAAGGAADEASSEE